MLRHLWRWLQTALMAAGATILLVTFTPLVPWMARQLAAGWTETDHGVLIVLGGSTLVYTGPESGPVIGQDSYWRAIHAIYLWRHGHFRTLLLSGAQTTATIEPLLEIGGIPESSILVEDRSHSTHENALFSKPILDGLPGPFVLLTSDYHSYRASRCFAKEGIHVETMPAPDILKRSNSLVARWQAFWDLCGEIAKIGYYRVKGWI